MSSLKDVALVIGASRGIGRQVAIDIAKAGYRVALAAKSTSDASKVHPFPPDPNSQQSTISTVEREIREAGGEAFVVAVDTRSYESIQKMIEATIKEYCRIDVLIYVLIYNSGAIWWSSVENTPMKRYQLMQQVNADGLYGTIQAALPYFKQNGWKARIIVVSPPIYSRFFKGKTAYAMGKVAMSVLTKGMAVDFQREGKTGMAITSIWPATAIQSAATEQPTGGDGGNWAELRKPTIYSDAILAMIRAPTETVNGLLELDEDFLRKYKGVTDFSKYSLVPGTIPRRIMPAKFPDLTVAEQDDEGRRVDSTNRTRSNI